MQIGRLGRLGRVERLGLLRRLRRLRRFKRFKRFGNHQQMACCNFGTSNHRFSSILEILEKLYFAIINSKEFILKRFFFYNT